MLFWAYHIKKTIKSFNSALPPGSSPYPTQQQAYPTQQGAYPTQGAYPSQQQPMGGQYGG